MHSNRCCFVFVFLFALKQVALCDNLELPFRDGSFDAVLSLAVVHHFATTERRVGAIRELARILRIGGRVIITVWALEQKQRRFESQDVLIPWQRPRTAKNSICSDEGKRAPRVQMLFEIIAHRLLSTIYRGRWRISNALSRLHGRLNTIQSFNVGWRRWQFESVIIVAWWIVLQLRSACNQKIGLGQTASVVLGLVELERHAKWQQSRLWGCAKSTNWIASLGGLWRYGGRSATVGQPEESQPGQHSKSDATTANCALAFECTVAGCTLGGESVPSGCIIGDVCRWRVH